MLTKKKHIEHQHQHHRSMDHFIDWVNVPTCYSDIARESGLIDESDEKAQSVGSALVKHNLARVMDRIRQHRVLQNRTNHYQVQPLTGVYYGGNMDPEFELIPAPHHGRHVATILYAGGGLGMSKWFGGSLEGQMAVPALPTSYPYLAIPVIPYLQNKDLEVAIADAGALMELPSNWDDNGAKRISMETLTSATNFLRMYSNFLLPIGITIPAPDINPCPDGTIDLSWRSKGARMLINIRNHEGNFHAFYYGDRYNNKMAIKGNVPVREFSESLAVWMKYLV